MMWVQCTEGEMGSEGGVSAECEVGAGCRG